MIDSSKWSVIEAGLKVIQGSVSLIPFDVGKKMFLQHASLASVTGCGGF